MKIVLVGSNGRLGAACESEWQNNACTLITIGRDQLDVASLNDIRSVLTNIEFDVLVNCTGMTNVDACEEFPELAYLINSNAVQLMAQICNQKNAKFVHFSTDYVFDGTKNVPYTETDTTAPMSVYGVTKERGETLSLQACDNTLIARVAWVFGPHKASFIDTVVNKAALNETVSAICDKFSTPSYTLDIARAIYKLITEHDAKGIYHLSNSGGCSFHQFAQHAVDYMNIKLSKEAQVLSPSILSEHSYKARRPQFSMLDTSKAAKLTSIRTWQEALEDYINTFKL